MAERVNGILKTEFLLSRPADLEQARKLHLAQTKAATLRPSLC
ncbi:hypothetical protein DFO62_11158 [Serratia fonticola]|nr:hypothetical protein DFO62_11158 [Serratia fonticola]